MSESKDPTQTAADQRGAEREALELPVRIRLGEQQLEAQSENISDAGALVVTEAPIEVRIVVGEGGEERAGRLVRLQPLGGGRIGLAVEFDS